MVKEKAMGKLLPTHAEFRIDMLPISHCRSRQALEEMEVM